MCKRFQITNEKAGISMIYVFFFIYFANQLLLDEFNSMHPQN